MAKKESEKDTFYCKQFTVNQENTAMKVGTDSILLGAWTDFSKSENCLDIGTGTGILALMAAQKSNAKIFAIECNTEAFEQAKANFHNSKWKNRILVQLTYIQGYRVGESCLFDTIICNPPFFTNGIKPVEKARNMARHTETLSFIQLCKAVWQLLTDTGAFFMIIPADLAETFILQATNFQLYAAERLNVKSYPHLKNIRTLIKFCKIKNDCKNNEMYIYKSKNTYSSAYIALTKDFYLKDL